MWALQKIQTCFSCLENGSIQECKVSKILTMITMGLGEDYAGKQYMPAASQNPRQSCFRSQLKTLENCIITSIDINQKRICYSTTSTKTSTKALRRPAGTENGLQDEYWPSFRCRCKCLRYLPVM